MQLTLWTSLACAFAAASAAATIEPNFAIVPACNDGEEPYPVQRFAQCEPTLSVVCDLLLMSISSSQAVDSPGMVQPAAVSPARELQWQD